MSAYSPGLGIPFFVSTLTVPAFFQPCGRMAGSLRAIEVAGGVVLVFVGGLLLTGELAVLNSYALRLMPAWVWQYL